MTLELSSKQLKKYFAPEELNIKSTENLQKLKGIIGQQRAVKALKFGLQIDGCGYNVYVSGPPGSGKMTSVQSYIEELAKEKESPSDWCYVNKFVDPYNPKSIQLPPGKGVDFKEDMNQLIERIQNELPKAFDRDDYNNQKEEILSDLKNRQEAISREMNEKAAKRGFKLQPTPMGIVYVPVKDDQPLTEGQMQSLSELG